MSRRRLVAVLAFLWLGVLSGFFYKYRGDLGTMAGGLTTARGERSRLARTLRAVDADQKRQAAALVDLRTAVAATVETCGAHAPDLSGRVAASEARLAATEDRLAEIEAQVAATSRAHARLRRRIFRE